MRISKTSAENISKEALLKMKEKCQSESRNFKVHVRNLVIDNTPMEVIEVFKKYPGFIETKSFFRFKLSDDSKVDHSYYHADKQLACGYEYISISSEKLSELQKKKRLIEKMEDDYKKSVNELSTALVQLGTYKRILAELPEMEKYLPSENIVALVPNMDKIRLMIQQ